MSIYQQSLIIDLTRFSRCSDFFRLRVSMNSSLLGFMLRSLVGSEMCIRDRAILEVARPIIYAEYVFALIFLAHLPHPIILDRIDDLGAPQSFS